MPIRIFNNIPALNAQRILDINNNRLASSVERVASGIRINRGADDAAGLAISESLRSDIRALKQAIRNANDGISLINVTEGALNEQSGILIRLRELASQSATGTVNDEVRATINLEFVALKKEIDRIAATTKFNGQALIDGSLASAGDSSRPSGSQDILIQVGIDATSDSRINLNEEINLSSVTQAELKATISLSTDFQTALTSALASGSITVSGTTATGTVSLENVNVLTANDSLIALSAINDFISTITAARGSVGAVQNRLVRTIANLGITVENLTAAESAIRDSDVALEIAELTRNQILVQSAVAMVGQANLIPQSVLALLQ